uniref:Nuclease HARBI1 n=1 Tax=Paramoeba aestuarina TaxID=180227 RepID=A0A6U2W2P8_9EUKA|mmetsp:Transcript_13386/g.20664  ORF Transcript_13386/g.20664 Transcript_13386/m.20664 type:complete len:255 (+) Transcript_13386:207-971(+)
MADDDEFQRRSVIAAVAAAAWWWLAAAELLEEKPTKERKERNRNHDRQFERSYAAFYDRYFNLNLEPHQRLPEDSFFKRFRMSKELYLRIRADLIEYDPFFPRRTDAVGKQGAFPDQKIVAAIEILTSGESFEKSAQGTNNVSDTMVWNSLQHFCDGVIALYEAEYLRSPTQEDVERLEKLNASRGFPGMLGSIDCMHWKWEKCPTAWAGQYTSGQATKTLPSVILEAICSYDTWFWHAYFGMAGANNDLYTPT